MDSEKRGEGQADEYHRAQRRIALLFDRLGPAAKGAPGSASPELSSRSLRVLLRHAAARHDFERQRKRLTDGGPPLKLAELFDLAASELPGWCAWLEDHDTPPPSVHSARAALARLVTHGQGPAERTERFGELAGAAARLLALGFVGQAACAVVEAERLIGDAAAPPEAVEAARQNSFGFDIELLRGFLGTAHARICLKRTVRFFRALQPVALLQALALEPKRERRHLLIDLLELHGQSARTEALDLLRSELRGAMTSEEAYVRRNLIFLLRRVPRPGEDGLDEEVAIVSRHAAPHLPSVVVKEAIGALAQLPGRRAEQALLDIRERLDAEADMAAAEDLASYRERLSSALERRETATKRRRPAATSSGHDTTRLAADLLPALLFELTESESSGSLLLEDRDHAEAGLVTLAGGQLSAAQTGALTGVDALWALLETYEGGTAVWQARPKLRSTPLFETARPMRELVLEGLRRRDERQLARSIVPDAARYVVRAPVPRPHPEESDGLLTRDVWAAAVAGQTPLDCERAVSTDPFRVRRLYLHWVEEGALEES